MKNVTFENSRWAVQLLLCVFVCCLISCGALRRSSERSLGASGQILQVAVSEIDLALFLQKVQEWNFAVVDVRSVTGIEVNPDRKESWITFQFASKNGFLAASSEIMSTGLVRRILVNH